MLMKFLWTFEGGDRKPRKSNFDIKIAEGEVLSLTYFSIDTSHKVTSHKFFSILNSQFIIHIILCTLHYILNSQFSISLHLRYIMLI
jgi:hypothetical protein